MSLCDTAGIALDGQERETLADWILGELRAEEGIGNTLEPARETRQEEPVAVGVAGGASEDPGA